MIDVKRVAAFPIDCQLISTGATAVTVKAKVMKLTHKGCLLEEAAVPLAVNSVHQLKFIFPVTHREVSEEILVYKTYDAFKGQHGAAQAGNHVAEVLFKNLTPHGRAAITDFLSKINVKKV